MLRLWTFTAFLCLFLACTKDTPNTLRVSSKNPRYFTDQSGKAIYLTGSHTWNNLVDMTFQNPADIFDYPAFLQFLKSNHHNFFRLWAWELLNWDTRGNRDENAKICDIHPHPWTRTGPGLASDSLPKFDLHQFNPDYFSRLKKRLQMAKAEGLYVAVMLFEGWGIQFSPDAYSRHPFYKDNNINDLGLDTATSTRLEIHELKNEKVLAIQEAYVKKVLETVHDFDNVLIEISNENHPASTAWQYHMIKYIKSFEDSLGVLHPVGMTFQYKGGSNQTLFDSPADWISPNGDGGYKDAPPPADGRKIIINDTDHLWGLGGTVDWIWKSFAQGMNTLFMDPYDGKVLTAPFDDKRLELLRRNLGYTLRYAEKMDLIEMTPSGHLTSGGYCLANPGMEYLIYLPVDSSSTLDLTKVSGNFTAEWFDPASGNSSPGEDIPGGSLQEMESPFRTGSSVLYLKLK